MGRPRKNPTDLNTQEELLDQSEKVHTEEPLYKAECKNVALSVMRNPVTQHWMLVSVKFDYTTKSFGEMTVLEEHTDRSEITHRFKVISGNEFFSPV